MTAPNPWSVVQASDYERHMGPAGVDQLAPLSALFQEAVLAAQPDRLLLVGCSTGNGLEHVDPSVTRRIVGVDVNLQHLGIARQRFFHLGPRLELYAADIADYRSPPQSFDLVHAALVLEYLHPEVLIRKVAEWLAERGTFSVVLQLAGGEPHAEPSRAMQLITKAMKLLPPEELTGLCEHYGLALRRQKEIPLKLGKRFWHGTYGRGAGGGRG
jgi:cyclopropane fatty-acyl-phospholipid synthase-like methyltransferase